MLTPNIFNTLKITKPGVGGEIQLTDAIEMLNHTERIVAHHVQGKFYDCGSKVGFVQATIDFALEREELRDEVLTYMKKVVEKVGKA